MGGRAVHKTHTCSLYLFLHDPVDPGFISGELLAISLVQITDTVDDVLR